MFSTKLDPSIDPHAMHRIHITQSINGQQNTRTIDLARPTSLLHELDIFPLKNGQFGIVLTIYLADKERPFVKLISPNVCPVSVNIVEQETSVELVVRVESENLYIISEDFGMKLEELAEREKELRDAAA